MISKNSETFQTMLNSQLKALQDLASADRALKGRSLSVPQLASHILTTRRQTTCTAKSKVEIYQP